MNCKKCGNVLDQNAKFCNACGEPVTIESNVSSVTVQETPVQSVAQVQQSVEQVSVQQVQQPVINQAPMQQMNSVQPAQTKKKNNTAFIIIVVILAIVVIALLGIVLFAGGLTYIFNTNNESESIRTTITTTTTTATTTAAPIVSSKYENLYGYKILVPSGFESVVEDSTVYIYNKLSKKQVGIRLYSDSLSDVAVYMETYKSALVNEGYTNVTSANDTYNSTQYVSVSYTYNGYSYTEYFIQLDDGALVNMLACYTNVVGENVMKDLVFEIYGGIETPTANFASTDLAPRDFTKNQVITDKTE